MPAWLSAPMPSKQLYSEVLAGDSETAKHHGPEGRNAPAGNGPQCLTLPSEPTRNQLQSAAPTLSKQLLNELLADGCLSVCLPACLSVCLSACLPASLPACLSVCLPASLPASLPSLFACLPACLSVCLPGCLLPCPQNSSTAKF